MAGPRTSRALWACQKTGCLAFHVTGWVRDFIDTDNGYRPILEMDRLLDMTRQLNFGSYFDVGVAQGPRCVGPTYTPQPLPA